MSRNVQANKKPHCKVCFDAGKPVSEYTSHWVRSLPDRDGKTTVICPTLLDTECRYCYNFGHTAKFCPAIKQREKEREKADRRAKATEVEKSKPKIQEKKNTSVFAALMEESDTEEEVKVSNPVENYPVLCAPTKKVENQEVKTGWAAIAAKPAEVKKPEPAKLTGLMLSDFIKVEEKKAVDVKPVQTVKPVPKSWADWSDSEDEDEIEEPDWKHRNDVVEEDDAW